MGERASIPVGVMVLSRLPMGEATTEPERARRPEKKTDAIMIVDETVRGVRKRSRRGRRKRMSGC